MGRNMYGREGKRNWVDDGADTELGAAMRPNVFSLQISSRGATSALPHRAENKRPMSIHIKFLRDSHSCHLSVVCIVTSVSIVFAGRA